MQFLRYDHHTFEYWEGHIQDDVDEAEEGEPVPAMRDNNTTMQDKQVNIKFLSAEIASPDKSFLNSSYGRKFGKRKISGNMVPVLSKIFSMKVDIGRATTSVFSPGTKTSFARLNSASTDNNNESGAMR